MTQARASCLILAMMEAGVEAVFRKIIAFRSHQSSHETKITSARKGKRGVLGVSTTRFHHCSTESQSTESSSSSSAFSTCWCRISSDRLQSSNQIGPKFSAYRVVCSDAQTPLVLHTGVQRLSVAPLQQQPTSPPLQKLCR